MPQSDEAERRRAERRIRRLTHRPLTPARAWRRWKRRRARAARAADVSAPAPRGGRFRPGPLAAPGLVLVAVAALAGWGWFDLQAARDDVVRARARLVGVATTPSRLDSEAGRAKARQATERAEAHIRAARATLRGSVPLRLAGLVPGLAGSHRAGNQLLDNALAAGGAASSLLETVDDIAGRMQIADGVVPLDVLDELEAAIRTAAGRLDALPAVDGRPWGPLAGATDEFERVVDESHGRLADAADAAGVARTFLGAEGRRRYFLAAMNNAEMRDSGAVLSYAVVEVDAGRIAVTRRGRTLDLTLKTPAPVDIPEGTEAVFGFTNPTRTWASVNATADFSFSGRAMAAMYEHATGEPVDGVIALDVPALASVLKATGPVTVPGLPEPLDGKNVARVLLRDLYESMPARSDQADRREVLGEVISKAVERVAGGEYEPLRLARLLGRAAQGLHFRLYSESPDEEAVLQRRGLGGGPARERPDRTVHFAVQNFTATKLDWYVRPKASVRVDVDALGNARLTTTIDIVNKAPVDAAPSYQLGPDGIRTTTPGQYLTQVYFWGPSGSLQRSGIAESGLVVNSDAQEVLAGETRSVEFTTLIPSAVRNGRLDLRFVPQPRLAPVPVEIELHAPGWTVDGARTVRLKGDVISTASWRLGRG